jgi:hypothetical protein
MARRNVVKAPKAKSDVVEFVRRLREWRGLVKRGKEVVGDQHHGLV